MINTYGRQVDTSAGEPWNLELIHRRQPGTIGLVAVAVIALPIDPDNRPTEGQSRSMISAVEDQKRPALRSGLSKIITNRQPHGALALLTR